MNDGLLVCIGMTIGVVVLFVLERRRAARHRRQRALQTLKWRADDRNTAVEFGKGMFYETGDPALDPEAYDSYWEYASVVREHLGLSDLCEIEAGTATALIDGVRHRVARLHIEGITTPTLLCNPDRMQSRVDWAGSPVTCLRCLAKEADDGA